jgi:hypothetical protein
MRIALIGVDVGKFLPSVLSSGRRTCLNQPVFVIPFQQPIFVKCPGPMLVLLESPIVISQNNIIRKRNAQGEAGSLGRVFLEEFESLFHTN